MEKHVKGTEAKLTYICNIITHMWHFIWCSRQCPIIIPTWILQGILEMHRYVFLSHTWVCMHLHHHSLCLYRVDTQYMLWGFTKTNCNTKNDYLEYSYLTVWQANGYRMENINDRSFVWTIINQHHIKEHATMDNWRTLLLYYIMFIGRWVDYNYFWYNCNSLQLLS